MPELEATTLAKSTVADLAAFLNMTIVTARGEFVFRISSNSNVFVSSPKSKLAGGTDAEQPFL